MNDPLITYPAGRDPRDWAKLSAIDTMRMTSADYVAEVMEWCLAVLRERREAPEWERRGS